MSYIPQNVSCVICKLLITERPQFWCYRCEKYACRNCHALNQNGPHFFLFEENPYIPTVKCIKCEEPVDNQFLSYNAIYDIEPLCNICLELDEVD